MKYVILKARPNLQLMPSKKNPRKRRWQKIDQAIHHATERVKAIEEPKEDRVQQALGRIAQRIKTIKEPQGKYGEAGETSEAGARQFDVADPNEFVKLRDKVPADKQKFLSQTTPEEMKDRQVFLNASKNCGFVLDNGDIQNLFSLQKGIGKYGMMEAIRRGGKTLDCFDGGLPEYYKAFGFKEYKREKNWTPGGPDVVYMRLE